MNRSELMLKWAEGDLISLGHRELIHYVWSDPTTGNLRICRPTMIEVGTYSRDKREWMILKRKIDFSDYEEAVNSCNGKLCRHCAAWFKNY
jgi:hypothetical protein